MYLIDTDVVSEARKRSKAHPGVREFLEKVIGNREALYLSVVTVGELRRGVEAIRKRGARRHAGQLERWLDYILDEYDDQILGIGPDIAQLWGAIRLPGSSNVLDRQIAATARIHDLVLDTQKEQDFAGAGVAVFNPFRNPD